MREALTTPRDVCPPAPRRPAATSRRAAAVLAWFGRVVPTLLVLAALAGLAYWGHHTGWTLPKFSALMGGEPAGDKDWCSEHGVPESQCVECQPDLLPRPKAPPYCKKHGVPECPLDYPQVAEVKGRPQLPKYDVLAALNLLERPEANRQCKTHLRRIQFASAAAADKAGLDVNLVQEQPLAEFVLANGEVGYDQTRVARLSTPVAGRAWRVDRVVGEPVRRGDVLALVDAAEVGKAKAEFQQAAAQVDLRRATLNRLRPLLDRAAVSDARWQEAETSLQEAEIRLQAARQALINFGLPLHAEDFQGLASDALDRRLRFLGLPESVTSTLDPKTTTANLLPVNAPLDGVVIAREVVAGEVVDTAKILFIIADPRRMWLTLNVRLEDAGHLALGQPVRFRPDGATAEAAGTVRWISTAVDEKTRTVKVRADLDNPAGRLRANTFGLGRIILRQEKQAVVVPKEALQSDGDCPVVFVRDKDYLTEGAPKVFHVRKVRPGARDERFVEVLAGVLPGEVVATKGSAILQAELLKGNLGDG